MRLFLTKNYFPLSLHANVWLRRHGDFLSGGSPRAQTAGDAEIARMLTGWYCRNGTDRELARYRRRPTPYRAFVCTQRAGAHHYNFAPTSWFARKCPVLTNHKKRQVGGEHGRDSNLGAEGLDFKVHWHGWRAPMCCPVIIPGRGGCCKRCWPVVASLPGSSGWY